MDRNQVDQGPWFDPDEITTRSQWEKIGDGSFGKVYKAHMLGTPVAIKVIQNLKPDRVNGLKRDMFYLQRLQHPNVVQVFGAFVEEGVLHMVMEFVPNSLRNKRVVNQVNIVRVLLDVARALVRMHAQGHIHRDVKARNVLISQDYEVAKLTDFGLARILPAYAGDREDVNPKTTPKIGPPKYRAPEVEKHDSELDPTYAFSSDVYGYGVMCYQLIDQVKKRRKKSHPHEVDFVTGLGNACCEEDPRARPTAAMCLAKCREFLGETWTANDRMWGNPNPSERCAYWTTDMMDVGTFKKVRAVMEEEQSKERSSSGLEQRVTPTTAPARGNGDGNGDGGNRKIVHNTVGGIDDRNNDSDDNDDFDDDGEDDDIQKRHENEQKLLKMFEDERRFQAKNASGAAAMRTTTVRNDGDYNNNYNDKNNNNIGTGTTTPTTTTTTSLRRRVIEQGGKEGKGLNRKRSKQLMVGEPNNNDEQNHMDIGGDNNTRNNIHNNNNNAAGGGGSIQNTQVAMVRSADGRITKTSSLGEDSDSQTPVSKYSRGENIQNETGPSAVRRLNSLSTLGMGDLKVEETRI